MPHFELAFHSGEASLSVRRIAVREALCEPFSVSVWAGSKVPHIALESLVGEEASLRLEGGTAHVRQLNARIWQGVCNHVEQVQAEPTGQSTYFLRIVPRLWLLTQRRGQRIYQHQSIPDIIDALLGEWRIAPVWKVDRGSYPKLEFKVQHAETDYAFFCRLLEEAGIAFCFHDDGAAQSLTLTDSLHTDPPRPGGPLPFVDNPNEASEKEYVTKVRLAHEVRPGASTIRDHDFRKPELALLGKAPPAEGREAFYEHYRHEAGAFHVLGAGGGTPFADDKGAYRHDPKFGTDLATQVLAGLRADKRGVLFETNLVDLHPGRLFAIDQHPHPEIGSGALMAAELELSAAPNQEWTIRGRALFVDPAVPYRPARRTPKPVAPGLQSAVVVGPPGAEIHCDEFGRVRVQLFWDREGKNDDASSCWMRVSQGWAGTGYGFFVLPRVGQEVLVAYLDGDPDHPIVAGRAFNARELVPYKLPDNKTVSTWKSQSSPGGGGFNEIKYEDKAGMELVYVQAQRDRNELVKRDHVESTGRNRLATVVGNEHLQVDGKRVAALGAEHVVVKGDRAESIAGAASRKITGALEETIGAHSLLGVKTDLHAKAGQTIVLDAGMRLTIQGPGGFIDIHAGGIDIVGTIVNINSGGSRAQARPATPATPDAAERAEPKDTPTA
jgi:type VI secretion system secreted protein VgrG